MTEAKDFVEGGGWSALDQMVREPTPAEEAKRNVALSQQYDKDAAYLRCFSGADGAVVLEDLTQQFIFKNSYNPGVVNPDQHGHFLEGHRNLVLMIMQRMERARDGNPAAKIGEIQL